MPCVACRLRRRAVALRAKKGRETHVFRAAMANARGRAAEYLGAGTNNANVTNDIQVRTEGIPAPTSCSISTT